MKNNKHFNSLIDPDSFDTNYAKDSSWVAVALGVGIMVTSCAFIYAAVVLAEVVLYGV